MKTKTSKTIIKKDFDFKIGADPEFVLTMQGRKVDAQQTMEYMLSGKKGFKKNTNSMGYNVEPFGNIGWDGSSSTAEVRPKPSNNAKEVVNNLAGIFKEFIKHVNIFNMSTISEFSSVGGHIHFEIPKGETWSPEKKNNLHRKLASFYLPVFVGENKTNLNLRIRQGYGSLKDSRIEEHFKHPDGSPGHTFEFRCPSAEWLTTPKIAAATLAYLGTVYYEIIHHPRNFSKFNDIIYKSEKQGEALQTLAIMEFEVLNQGILNKAKKYVRTFEMYEQYKDEIEYIFNPKQIIKDKSKADYNIVTGWNLIEKTALPKKSEIMSSKRKMQAMAKEKDFDELKKVMNIHYNDDTNVGLFAENLKDRVAAFNWKLKNNYFIFGVRKGITEILAQNLKKDYLSGDSLIKTTSDKEYTDRLFDKMVRKFGESHSFQNNMTIDFKTGKPKDIRESTIIIGIPYDMRTTENVNPFLEFIWKLEKGEIKQNDKKENTPLINDENFTEEHRGELYKILAKKKTEVETVILDDGSVSLRNNLRAIEGIIIEEQQQEEEQYQAFHPLPEVRFQILYLCLYYFFFLVE